MYSIVFTQGNKETIIEQRENLEDAKALKRELEKNPNYCNGLLTIEQRTEKGSKVFG